MILFLDGSLSETIVGVVGGSFRRLPSRGASDGLLFQEIKEIITTSSLRLEDISAIAVGSGPGSHTGTRASAAAAKGLAMGLQLPLKLFPSLLLTLPQTLGRIGTSLPTRREKLFVLIYNTHTKEIEFQGLLSVDELEQRKASLDCFGHDLSPFHLENFLNHSTPSSLTAPLSYLQL
jgi:tRNA A37 threonylcarbamoyladenosine modification protein TsaB